MGIKSRIEASSFYPILRKMLKVRECRARKQRLLQEARVKFEEEHPTHGSFKDYKLALKKHFVSYSEYMHQYEFWRLTEAERNQFISRNALGLFYYDIPWKIKQKFWDKVEFLNLFSLFIYREWLCARHVSFEVFSSFVLNKECIAKPMDSCCGAGIFKIFSKDCADLRQLYARCVKNDVLIEECIVGCGELQSFHPRSLNSIRVVTVSDNSQSIVFGAFFRMGMGDSVVDNAHAGGLFAQINIETGEIESEGIDTNGHRYVEHPDSHRRIKGFIIPRWEEIKSVCIQASRVIPENPITGWDVVINSCGQIEFIEGNHGPDFDLMQSPLKVGVKERLRKYVRL